MEHKLIQQGQIHAPHNWEVPNAAARNALEINDPDELKKLLLQLDNGQPSYWLLVGVSPAQWLPISGAPGESFEIDEIGPIADRGDFDNQASGFTYLANDEVPPKLYIRQGDTPGVWSEGSPFGQGATGEGVPPGGSAGQVLVKIDETDYNSEWRGLTKSDVGLDQVSNIAPADLPVSDATQIALNEKANSSDVADDIDAINTALSTKANTSDVASMFSSVESELSDIDTTLDSKVDVVPGKGLSTNDYTDDDKTLLESIHIPWRGTFVSLAALEAAVLTPPPQDGDYAIVDEGIGETPVQYNWDSSDNQWTQGGGGVVSSTDVVPEGSINKYFTSTRVLDTVLIGLSIVTGSPVTNADSVLSSIGKLQGQINDIVSSVTALDGRVDDVETDVGTLETSVGTLGTTVADLQTDVDAITTLPYFKHPYETSETLVIGDGERAVSAGISVVGEGSITVTGDGRLAIV